MHKRNLAVILCLVLALGLFFQYNRTDGFVRLFRNTNTGLSLAGVTPAARPASAIQPAERYLLVYDSESAFSLLLKRNVERTLQYQKKEVESTAAKAVSFKQLNYTGVIFVMDNLDKLANFNSVREYTAQGGSVYFLTRLMPGPTLQRLQQELGFAKVGPIVDTPGVKLLSSLLIRAQGFERKDAGYVNSSLAGSLRTSAKLHMVSQTGLPLAWEQVYGKGKYIVYNGSNLANKSDRGLITGLLALGKSYYLYPVIGSKVVYIDDFPAPVPEGTHPLISRDYQLTIPQFYRQIWWPDMLRTAERYNVRYTGLVIETYNDKVKPPFILEDDHQANKNNLISYGRELLKSGGEMGIHGYNHQSLAPPGFASPELGYKPWQSTADMAESLREVRRYVAEAYPFYKLKVYVPPSNVLSPQGRQALVHALPDLKIIASLYHPGKDDGGTYLQEYTRSPDGILEMPRLSYGYTRSASADWEIMNGITQLGVFSHFVHPDNIFYEKSQGKGWRQFHEEFESLLKDIQTKYSWLKGSIASEAGERFENFLDTEYRLKEEQDKLTIFSWGFRDHALFVLKTPKKIREAKGCQFQLIDDNTYLLTIREAEAVLSFESEVKR